MDNDFDFKKPKSIKNISLKSAQFYTNLAILEGDKTIAELCQEFDLASRQIYVWKKDLEEGGPKSF